MSDLTAVYSRSAAAAYRSDMKGRKQGDAFGPHDGTWIEIASLLEHATHLDDDAAAVLIRDAVELAESIVKESEVSMYCGRVPAPSGQRGRVESIQLLTQELEAAGAIALAELMLESIAAAHRSMTAVELGRVVTQRARIAWKSGQIERARALYRRVRALGQHSEEIELEIRATLGFASVANAERNFDEARRLSSIVARLADRHGYAALSRSAHNILMVAAATRGEFSDALLHAGRLYELAGTSSVALSEILVNVGQLLYSAGHPEPSRAAFAAVLSKTQRAGIGLPALGGFALACSAQGDKSAVAWAFAELERLAPPANAPLESASAYCECATALLTVGDAKRASMAKEAAFQLASKHGFDALVERAAAIEVTAAPEGHMAYVLSPKAKVVARRFESLQPKAFPFRVSLIAAA